MQRATHTRPIVDGRPRFRVNTYGVLTDRNTGRPTRFSMDRCAATRSEMRLLANMLNDPAHAQAYDKGESIEWEWARRIEAFNRARREMDIDAAMEAAHA